MIESCRVCCHRKVVARHYVIKLCLRSLCYPHGTFHYCDQCYVSCGKQYKFFKSCNLKVTYVVQCDSLARGPKLLSIKIMLLR